MRIGIDIDDTISNTNDCLIKQAIIYDKQFAKGRGFKDPEAYSLMEMFYWSVLDVDGFFKWFKRGNYYLTFEPIEQACEILQKLTEDGHEIILITKRTNNLKNRNLTKKWLKKYGFKYQGLYLGCDKKGELCQALNIDLFIDNDKYNCLDAVEYNIPCILKGTKYNQIETKNKKDSVKHDSKTKKDSKKPKESYPFKRIESWEDIYKYIKKTYYK